MPKGEDAREKHQKASQPKAIACPEAQIFRVYSSFRVTGLASRLEPTIYNENKVGPEF